MRSRKYVPGILVDGRGLRGPKGEKGDPGFVASEISSYVTNLTDYAGASHSHGNILGHNITATSATNGLTLSVGNYLTTAALSNHSHTDYTSIGTMTTHTHGAIYTITKTGTNISFSSASSGLSMSIPAYLTTAAVSWHSHNDLYMPLANTSLYLTTAALSNHSHGAVTALGNIVVGSSSNGAIFSVSEGMRQLTIGGNTVGTAGAISTGTVMLAAGGIITLSKNGNTITIYATGGGTGGGEVGTGVTTASTASGTNMAVTLGSAGMNFVYPRFLTTARASNDAIGLNTAMTGGSMTANSSGLSINLPSYLTTAMVSNAGSNFIGLNTAITNGSMTADSRGISINTPNYANSFIGTGASITGGSISVNSAGISLDISPAAGIGLNTAITGGSMTANTSGISINVAAAAGAGLNSAITGGSLTVNTSGISINLPAYLTTAMASNASSAFAGLNSAITGGSMTLNTSGLSLNIPPAGVAAQGSGTNVISAGTLVFSNSNGISFGLNGSTMTASYASGNYVLTGISSVFQHTSANSLLSSLYQLTANNSLSLGNTYSSHTHGSIYTSSITGSLLTNSSASNGLTLGIPAYITSAGAHTHDYAATNHSHGSVAITGGIGITSASSGLSVSLPEYLTTVPSAGSVYFSNVSTNNITFGSSTSGYSTTITALAQASGRIYFTNANGVTFGTSTNGISTTVSASVNTVGGGTGGVAIGNTANSSAFTSGSVMISGANLTVNTSVTGASQYLQISAPAIGYLFFSNTNGHSWSSSTSGASTSIYVITS